MRESGHGNVMGKEREKEMKYLESPPIFFRHVLRGDLTSSKAVRKKTKYKIKLLARLFFLYNHLPN